MLNLTDQRPAWPSAVLCAVPADRHAHEILVGRPVVRGTAGATQVLGLLPSNGSVARLVPAFAEVPGSSVPSAKAIGMTSDAGRIAVKQPYAVATVNGVPPRGRPV